MSDKDRVWARRKISFARENVGVAIAHLQEVGLEYKDNYPTEASEIIALVDILDRTRAIIETFRLTL